MKTNNLVDHLFRHQHGKMVAVLVRIFGLSNLETIQDAVQDTFIKAMLSWRTTMPENPEAWLMQAAKNRSIDLLRKLKVVDKHLIQIDTSNSSTVINEMFLDHEIEDSQLRMIFTACHPILNPKDQIAFALKTIGGFSDKEIAAALLLKEDTVKKRLSRARKTIKDQNVSFTLPDKIEIDKRVNKVLEVLYLIFNEGFHSSKPDLLIRKDLCGEAIRLCTLLLKKEVLRSADTYALFAIFCFHASRLESKLPEDGKLLDLKTQDRTQWHAPLINLGNESLAKSMKYQNESSYQLEAAIAGEHANSKSFESTNWKRILELHAVLEQRHPSEFRSLNLAIILVQLERIKEAMAILDKIHPEKLESRTYLFYGVLAECLLAENKKEGAIDALLLALNSVSNQEEKIYIKQKLDRLRS